MGGYAQKLAAFDPIVNFPLDDAAGLFKNTGNFGRYGEISGGAAHGSDALFAAGPSVDFDGTNGAIDIGADTFKAVNGASALTMLCWFKADALPAAASAGLALFLINSTQIGASLSIYDGKLSAGGRSQSGDSSQSAVGATALNVNQAYFYAAQFDFSNDEITVFLNGVQDGQAAASFGAASYTHGNPSGVDSVGAWLAGSNLYFDGKIAGVAVCQGLIPANDLLGLYELGADQATYKVNGTVQVDSTPASRIVRAYNEDSGELIGETVSDAGDGSYEITFPDQAGGNIVCTVHNDYGEPWEPSKSIALAGDTVTPTTANGHYYSADGPGTTGASEPAWPTDGGTVNDNGITWTDEGEMVSPDIHGPFVPVEV